MLKNFKTYQLALNFHSACKSQEGIPSYLKDQLFRASSSVALNLAEGCAKPSRRDQAKFYYIALGSLRESQAAIEFIDPPAPALKLKADQLGASIYCLIRSTEISNSRFWKRGER